MGVCPGDLRDCSSVEGMIMKIKDFHPDNWGYGTWYLFTLFLIISFCLVCDFLIIGLVKLVKLF